MRRHAGRTVCLALAVAAACLCCPARGQGDSDWRAPANMTHKMEMLWSGHALFGPGLGASFNSEPVRDARVCVRVVLYVCLLLPAGNA